MQWMSRRFLALLHCRVTLSGVVPAHGLIACNHLGYVDILVIGSLCPAIFVAKSDVEAWPIFGWLASRAGTIFVSRQEPAKVAAQLREMELPLSSGHPVVLFPEGTSSCGHSVLPFRSSLFESVLKTGSPITPAAISYDLGGEGDVGHEVAYWGDHLLLPHLLNLLSKKSFTATLSLGATRSPMADRKSEAAFLHQEVSALHARLS
jgi:1-acyl-sn-glycerol-3-phosphate acyltransferase